MTPLIPLPLLTSLEVKEVVNTRLGDLFARQAQIASQASETYGQLWQTIAMAAQGGKRIRPYLLLLTYQVLTGKESVDEVVPAAVAQELLHIAMLIHDDIIDRDEMRHGEKNVIGHYLDVYAPHIADAHERRHFANSTAILAGDLLISQAYSQLATCTVAPERIAAAQQVLDKAIFDVIGGELVDTELAFRQLPGVSAQVVAEQKTASYSFVSPLMMAAQLADVSATTQETLRLFGMVLGVAYQYADDMLGVFGDSDLTGKSVSSDIREGKQTYLVEQFYRLANPEQREEFDGILGHQDATDTQVARARQLLVDSGARQAVDVAIADLADQARRYLRELEFSESMRTAFEDVIDRCVRRSA